MNLWDLEVLPLIPGTRRWTAARRRSLLSEAMASVDRHLSSAQTWRPTSEVAVFLAERGADLRTAAAAGRGEPDHPSAVEVEEQINRLLDMDEAPGVIDRLLAVAHCYGLVDGGLTADGLAGSLSKLYDVAVAIDVSRGSLDAERESVLCRDVIADQRALLLEAGAAAEY